MEAKIPVNTIGTVMGWENKLVQVRVSITVNDKTKSIDHGFKVDFLEPQKDCMLEKCVLHSRFDMLVDIFR